VTAEISDAMEQIYRIEAALVSSAPYSAAVKRVYPFFPSQTQVIKAVDCPCFLNTYSPTNVDFRSSLLMTGYTIHPRLFVYDGNRDKAAAIAASFVEPIIDSFAANIKFGLQRWTLLGLRFNEEQPREWASESEAAGLTFIGLDFFLDVMHTGPKTYQVGAAPP